MPKLKSAQHHWWPIGLSSFWANNQGLTNRLSWDGTLLTQEPKKFGSIGNAHHVKFDEDNVWNHSLEPVFGNADSSFPDLAKWLLNLQADTPRPKVELKQRFTFQEFPDIRRRQLAKGLASLLVRSPNFRNRLEETVRYYKGRFDQTNLDVENNLIVRNMAGCYEHFSKGMESSGKFIALISTEREFIWGDGFLHNYSTRNGPPFGHRAVLPLLPTVTIVYARPSSYFSHPEILILSVTAEETELLNDIVQVYSKDYLFYRCDEPSLKEFFSERKFCELTYHKHAFLESLIEAASQSRPRSTTRA